MGMTIEKAIKYYENKNVVLTEEEALANTLAINTMRKYQKIQQILSDWTNDDFVGMSDYWMGRIKEVIEDGNDD